MSSDVRRPRPSQETRPADGATNIQFTDWRADAQRALRALARCGVPFHVDDLLMLVGYPPSTKQIGAIFATASSNHLIEIVGAALAEDGRLVRVWRGVTA
jgi:hypothetical protein